jgi:hypothetical protein
MGTSPHGFRNVHPGLMELGAFLAAAHRRAGAIPALVAAHPEIAEEVLGVLTSLKQARRHLDSAKAKVRH